MAGIGNKKVAVAAPVVRHRFGFARSHLSPCAPISYLSLPEAFLRSLRNFAFILHFNPAAL